MQEVPLRYYGTAIERKGTIMYECPNCGGNLRYDIAAQQLLCGYCGTVMDPYHFHQAKDVEERREYEATVFSCPQCGAEILSEDTTAATFCSFCGSTAILDSRIGMGRRPMHIIPFARTKEDCKAAYARMMRRAIFAPKELKDQEYIEKFRGIYMPYWLYSFEKRGQVTFNGSESRQKGDYLYTKHYQITSDIDSAYYGITYDAAAAFSDDLSSAIAPFDLSRVRPFCPSFLSGFYADIGDVDKSVYRNDAQEMALEDGISKITADRICSRYHVSDKDNRRSLQNALRPDCTAEESAMLPVWFLSYRKGDRVAYAVVNGQTGKAAADLPVDRRKYVIGSLLLAIPLFFLLNIMLTITPAISLLLSAALAFVCAVVSVSQLSRIIQKETREDDKGFTASQLMRGGANNANAGQCASGKNDISRMIVEIMVGSVLVLGFFIALLPMMVIVEMNVGGNGIVTTIITMLLIGWFCARASKPRPKKRRIGFKVMFPILLKPGMAIVLALVILLWNPVSDLYFYIGAIISMGAVIWTLMDIIGRYNVLTTRKLPQFNRRGGDYGA